MQGSTPPFAPQHLYVWVVIKELDLSYYSGGTLLVTIYNIAIMVTLNHKTLKP